MILKGKLHQRAPEGSASTQTNTRIQQHRKKSTTPTMMNGVRLVLAATGVEGMAAGLAGTLPAYSAGGGGGGVAGRGIEGTAAARGETIVAPASTLFTSNTRIICSPKEPTSTDRKS